jgi:hypothetical protein
MTFFASFQRTSTTSNHRTSSTTTNHHHHHHHWNNTTTITTTSQEDGRSLAGLCACMVSTRIGTTHFLSQYNPTAYVDEDNYMGHGEYRDNAIHRDLRAISNLLPWTSSVSSDLVSGLAGPPSNPDMALTVVAVPKSCWTTTIATSATTTTTATSTATVAPPSPSPTPTVLVVPVISVLYCPMFDTGENYPVAGVMLNSQYLPGRLAQVDLFTNVPVPTTLTDPLAQQQQQQHVPPPPPDERETPHYAFLSISQDLISYQYSQAFLAGDYNVGPVQDMETLQHIPVFPGGIVGGGGAGWIGNDVDDDNGDAMEEDEDDV